MSGLQAAAARAQSWLTGAALPIWGSAGVDADGAFHELLNFDGSPDLASNRRMRVQARQLYVFSEAALRGWDAKAGAIADHAFERFLKECWAADGQPGFIHLMTPDRKVLDSKRDAYDHAFGLFALAWRYKASGDERARVLAGQVMDFMHTALADPAHGGFAESIPVALPRRADPHMHFLEACLEWLSATGEARYLASAQAMVDLFAARFVDPETGTLGEYFAPDLTPAPGAAGQATMAGHHFEWVWLLDQAGAAGVRVPEGHGQRLYDLGLKGLDRTGFAIDESDRAFNPVRASRRAWPQTEMIKAYVTVGEHAKAAAATEAFLDSYLATDVPGLWQDQYDASGLGLTPKVPASTLYHIVVAFRELILLAERQA